MTWQDLINLVNQIPEEVRCSQEARIKWDEEVYGIEADLRFVEIDGGITVYALNPDNEEDSEEDEDDLDREEDENDREADEDDREEDKWDREFD